ncbi:hypothetical protein STEG23_037647, partial [Scotinomys teguina]
NQIDLALSKSTIIQYHRLEMAEPGEHVDKGDKEKEEEEEEKRMKEEKESDDRLSTFGLQGSWLLGEDYKKEEKASQTDKSRKEDFSEAVGKSNDGSTLSERTRAELQYITQYSPEESPWDISLSAMMHK